MSRSYSWYCTVFTQLILCVALYVVLNLGQPEELSYQSETHSRNIDVNFISVRGGFRPLHLQTLLLKQMDKAAKIYRARFVVNISELGKDDPLLQNGTLHFPSLKVPWYTTTSSKGQEPVRVTEQIKLPRGKTLDIIVLDTGSIEDTLHDWLSSGIEKLESHWLSRTPQTTNSTWRIAAGFHPMVSCKKESEQGEATKIYEPLHKVLVKIGVNTYLSSRNCTNYARQDGVTYIGNPSLMKKEQFLPSAVRRFDSHEDMLDGFLLHRVSPLEIVTYFVNLRGEVVDKTIIQQSGREVM